MSAGDYLKFKSVFVDSADNFFRIIPGIDTDRAFGLLTTEDAGVLLKSRNSDFFDNHL